MNAPSCFHHIQKVVQLFFGSERYDKSISHSCALFEQDRTADMTFSVGNNYLE